MAQSMSDQMGDALDELISAETALDELAAVQRLESLVTRAKAAIVRQCLEEHSYRAVGDILRISRQAVAARHPKARAAA